MKLSRFSALATFALFTLCAVGVLLGGVGVYRRLAAGGEDAFTARTSVQYLRTRVRQCPRQQEIRLEPFGAVTALVLPETVEGETYLTRVYCYDGYLMELFTAQGGSFAPEDGEKLLEAEELTFALADGVLQATLTDGRGVEQQVVLCLRHGREAAA